MRHFNRSLKVTAAAALVLSLLVSVASCRRNREPGLSSRFPMIRGLWFEDIKREPPFTAVVESKQHGVWPATLDGFTGRPKPESKPTEYVGVYLRKLEGERICI